MPTKRTVSPATISPEPHETRRWLTGSRQDFETIKRAPALTRTTQTAMRKAQNNMRESLPAIPASIKPLAVARQKPTNQTCNQAMSAIPDFPNEPTMRDVVAQLVAVHRCLHEGQSASAAANKATYEQLREHRQESRDNAEKVQAQIGVVSERVANTEGQLDVIRRTVGAPAPAAAGAPPPPVKPRLLSLQPWQALAGGAAALAAAAGGYKILTAVVTAFHAAMLGAP